MSTPALVRLNQKMKGKDFAILSISVDDDPEPVPAFLKKEKVEYTVLYADREVSMNYRVSAIPTFYLIDKKGLLFKAYSGYAPSMEQDWEQEINTLLKP